MNTKIWQKLQFAILLLICVVKIAHAQNVEMSAYLNSSTVSLDQQFELSVELTGSDAQNVPQPDVPAIEEFAAFRGTSSSQNIQIVNGQMSVTKIYKYHFIATKVGSFQIPAINLNFMGKTLSTKAVAIEIVKGATTPAQGNPSGGASQNTAQDLTEMLFLKAEVNKQRVYQNEIVVVTYKIYTAVNITSYGISQLPNTVGFWSEEFTLPNRPPLHNEVVNGQQYRVAEIKKVALFPQGSGKKSLDPLVIDCEVQMPRQRRRRDIFDSFFEDPFFNRSERRSIRSNSLSIEVMPLPQAGKPDDFSGAVGNFSVTASVDKNAVKTNEAITLKTSIAGTGNIKIIPGPKIDFSADFEVYDPEVKESITREGGKISGSKTFEYVLIPRFPGNQIIKPVTFSYFDLNTNKYKRISTQPIEIVVAKGDDKFVAAPIGTSKEDVKFIGQDIRFIQLHLPEFKKIGPIFYKKMYFYILLFLPLVFITSAFFYKKHIEKMSSNVAYARNKKANQMALKRLKVASKKLREGNPREFYGEVSRALTGFIGDKMNVPAAGLITDQVDSILRRRGIDEQVVVNFLECLKTCDFKRFAPGDSDNGEMKDFFVKAKNAIINLEKVI